jgi:hypothetical protein
MLERYRRPLRCDGVRGSWNGNVTASPTGVMACTAGSAGMAPTSRRGIWRLKDGGYFVRIRVTDPLDDNAPNRECA